MGSMQKGFLLGKTPASLMVLILSLKTAWDLELFDLIAKASNAGSTDGHLTAAEIASLLPTKNPEAPAMLDRILRLIATASFVNCKVVIDEEGNAPPKRLYKLASLGELLVRNDEDEVYYSEFDELVSDKVFTDSWGCLKDTILEGGFAFDRAHGMNVFEYASKDSRFNEVFNNAMLSWTSLFMKKLLEAYHGFGSVNDELVVDVGGGLGSTAAAIVAEYPNIHAINFDLPHVIKNAPPITGVEHVGGDMFESVPAGNMIILKWILHNWNDDQCLKILKNCFKALLKTGKVIVIEKVLPEYPAGDMLSDEFHFDVAMLVTNPGGKERTLKEWEGLAKRTGFSSIMPICRASNEWVIEFYKE